MSFIGRSRSFHEQSHQFYMLFCIETVILKKIKSSVGQHFIWHNCHHILKFYLLCQAYRKLFPLVRYSVQITCSRSCSVISVGLTISCKLFLNWNILAHISCLSGNMSITICKNNYETPEKLCSCLRNNGLACFIN